MQTKAHPQFSNLIFMVCEAFVFFFLKGRFPLQPELHLSVFWVPCPFNSD